MSLSVTPLLSIVVLVTLLRRIDGAEKTKVRPVIPEAAALLNTKGFMPFVYPFLPVRQFSPDGLINVSHSTTPDATQK
jgi:hypothetical protein